MEALIRVRFDAAEVQGVGLRRIEPRLAASAGVVVLTNKDIVLQQHDRGTGRGRGLRREGHVGGEVRSLVVAVEVDLEHAPDVRLVVRMIVECHVIDLDRSIVSGRVLGEGGRRQPGERHASGDGCRPAGPACESSNRHGFPREDPLSKATYLAFEAAATYQPCGRSPQGRFRRGWTSASNSYEPLTRTIPGMRPLSFCDFTATCGGCPKGLSSTPAEAAEVSVGNKAWISAST